MNQHIVLSDTTQAELPAIIEMEQGEAREFVMPYTLQKHQIEFKKPDVIYKSIRLNGAMIGFLILVLDPDGRSVEFRRIVISRPDRGHGKEAVKMVNGICWEEFDRSRIWLDVFETNARARSVYERFGYQPFGTSSHEGRTLILYEKILKPKKS